MFPIDFDRRILWSYFPLLFLSFSGIFTSCKNETQSSNVSTNSSDIIAVAEPAQVEGVASERYPFDDSHYVECAAEQEFAYFKLNRIEGIDTTKLGFAVAPISEPIGITNISEIPGTDPLLHSYNIRFDFCLGKEEKFYFHRIILEKRGAYSFGQLQPKFIELKPTNIVTHPVFADMLLEYDFSNIHMVFRPDRDRDYSYLIRGYRYGTESFLSISTFDDTPLSIAPGSEETPSITLGVIEYGDSFVTYDRSIDLRDWQEVKYIKNENGIKIDFRYQVECTGGGYRNYKFSNLGSLVIEDQIPGDDEPIKIEMSASGLHDDFLGGMERPPLPSNFTYISSHHNLSDRFIFSHPKATYSLHKSSGNQATLKIEYSAQMNLPSKNIEMTRDLKPLSNGRRSKC